MPSASWIAGTPYISLTSYRRDGTPVSTPVWCVSRGEFLFVWTRADSGKVKRIRRDPAVRIAICDVRGRESGPAWPASARVVGGGAERMVRELMADKYGAGRIRWSERWARLRRRSTERVAIQITLGGDLSEHDDSPVFQED